MKYTFLIVFSVIIILYSLINYYVGIRFWQILLKQIPYLNKTIYWILFWIIVFSYFLGRLSKSFLPHYVSNFFTLMGSYWLGVMFYSFLIFLIFDLLIFINKFLNLVPNSKYTSMIGLIPIFIILGIVIYGIWNAKSPQVVRYNITIPKKVENLESMKIIALSDIHLGNINDEVQIQKAANIINKLNPDLVLFLGDTIDEDINIFKEKNMAKIFSQINSKYGKYAILGNHEYIGGHIDEAIYYIEKSDIKLLRDNYIKVNDNLYLVGRDDLSREAFIGDKTKALSEIIKDVDKNMPIILMDHQPSRISEAEQNNVDIHLSGHTHKGQVFPSSIITKMLFENDYGHLKKGNFNSIVSCGFGTWGPPLRVGSKPEILEIIVNFM